MTVSYIKQLGKIIGNMPDGSVVTVMDFTSIANPKTVSKMLTRLEKNGMIVKVMRSVFWKPDHKNILPEPDEMARAIARENDWSLAPSGKTALHTIGLEKNESKDWTYITDGTYRTYRFKNYKIIFSHTNRSILKKMSERTLLLVQTLKAYGEGKMPEEVMKRIAELTEKWEKNKVMEEIRDTAEWIKRDMAKIFGHPQCAVTVKRNR